jgi:hypothetical protein
MIGLLSLNFVSPSFSSEIAGRRNVTPISPYCQGEFFVEDFINLVKGSSGGVAFRLPQKSN